MRTFTLLAAAGAALSLCACAAVTEAPVGAYAVAPGYQVSLGMAWSDISKVQPLRSPKVRVLSVDGPFLDRLFVSEGLSPGEGLVRKPDQEHRVPLFRADMTPREQVEFVSDSVAAMGLRRVEAADLKPATLAGGPAVRFALSALTEEGLETSGAATVAQVKGKLYVILFLAPKEHYFEALRPEVEKVMESARLTG